MDLSNSAQFKENPFLGLVVGELRVLDSMAILIEYQELRVPILILA